MSGKIKAKDLSYDTSLPPFLQRLHAAKGGSGDADRHERAIARPKKAKDVNEDDGPTVVGEDGEMLSKDEFEKLTKADEEAKAAASAAELEGAADVESAASKFDRKVTDGVAVKKRKIVKVVGDDEELPKDPEATTSKAPKKAKKKSKPVKLAFDDDGN